MGCFVCFANGEEFESAEVWAEHLKICNYCSMVIKLAYEQLCFNINYQNLV
ncbi:MAG: hypothetical protein ACP5FQ_06305 [Thermoplasmata archaeon]